MIDFSRYTQISRQTIQKAYRIAIDFHSDSITPEIMLVALMQEAKEMVNYILQFLNVDKTSFFQSVSETIHPNSESEIEHPDISGELQNVFQKADELAEETDSSVVAPEHIFMAFRFTDGQVKDIMKEYGIDKSRLKKAVNTFRNVNIDGRSGIDYDSNELPALRKYAVNLNIEAQEGRIENVIGRDNEIRRILQILSRKTKNNPLLVGEPGTGKTAIVEGLIFRLIRGDVPMELKGMRVYSLDMTSLMAGSGVPGEFEQRLKGIIEEASSNSDIVLFIDEIHLLIGAGRSAGAMDAANILKPAMARGKIRVIGATTLDENRKYIESDKAFQRRFQTIIVDEPDTDSAISILRGIKSRFENYHRIKILDEAIVSAVKLSQRYIGERFLPDKAIDVLDEAASRMRISRSSVPVELDELTRNIRIKEMERESLRQDDKGHDLTTLNLEIDNLKEQLNTLNAKWQNERTYFDALQEHQNEISRLQEEYEECEKAGMYSRAIELKNELAHVKEKLGQAIASIEENTENILKPSLDEEDIREVVTSWTHIPVGKLNEDESEKLINLSNILKQSVKGQDEAVKVVENIIRRNRMDFGEENRPIGSFLFLGTTGVGKTELAKALAEHLFGSGDMMIRIDMSEYQQEHSVARLFGAPPGYVGFDQGGQLTEAVRRKPYSVVLLDEIEKAHRKVFDTLLQVLDDGRMTDGQGHVVDFKNTIIIMTSNMGAQEISEFHNGGGVGYATSVSERQQDRESLKRSIVSMLKHRISPEFINRIDEIILFNPLSIEIIKQITASQVRKLESKMRSKGIELEVRDVVIDYISSVGFDATMGARPIKRAINNLIIDPLSQALLVKDVSKEGKIIVDFVDNDVYISNVNDI